MVLASRVFFGDDASWNMDFSNHRFPAKAPRMDSLCLLWSETDVVGEAFLMPAMQGGGKVEFHPFLWRVMRLGHYQRCLKKHVFDPDGSVLLRELPHFAAGGLAPQGIHRAFEGGPTASNMGEGASIYCIIVRASFSLQEMLHACMAEMARVCLPAHFGGFGNPRGRLQPERPAGGRSDRPPNGGPERRRLRDGAPQVRAKRFRCPPQGQLERLAPRRGVSRRSATVSRVPRRRRA